MLPATSVLSADYWTDLFEGAGEAWNRFWYTPASPLPLAVMRIGTGLVTLLYLLSFNSDLTRWFANNGILTPSVVSNLDAMIRDNRTDYHYSLLSLVAEPGSLWLVHGLAIAATLAFTFGLFTRLTGILTLLAVLSYVHRAPMLTRQVEPVLSLLLFYLCIGPSGARLSLDRWVYPRLGWQLAGERSTLANIAIRLLQVHGAAFYAMLGLTKLYGDAWWSGEAIWMLAAQTHSRPIDLTFIRNYPYLVNAWTHGVVAYELLFPLLIWNRLARPLMLAIGVAVWVSIALATGLLPYCLAMLVLNRAFIPAERYERWVRSDKAGAALA